VRQTLFNWLGQSLHGLHCLDAFAGSGALGFEAASRGAARVLMCEVDRAAVAALQDNRNRFAESASETSKAAAAACEIAAMPVEQWLSRHSTQFDVVFCDPPFQTHQQAAFLQRVRTHLAPGARVYVEADGPLEAMLAAVPGVEWLKTSKAGAVYFGLLRLDSVG
jgi:16S rRNA (guanine966-N2)-methyltransferase